jgi:hypothetical protein
MRRRPVIRPVHGVREDLELPARKAGSFHVPGIKPA